MRGLRAAQLNPRERQSDDLERQCHVDRARVGNDVGQTESDRHHQHNGTAEQQRCVFARVARVTRRAGEAAAAAAAERDHADEKLQAVEGEQGQEQTVQAADDTPTFRTVA
jgi:hypothetical protein